MDLSQHHTSQVLISVRLWCVMYVYIRFFCFFSCGLVCMEKEGVLILFQEIVIFFRQSKLFFGTANKHFAKL